MNRFSRYSLLTFLFLAASFLSGEVWMQAVRHTSFAPHPPVTWSVNTSVSAKATS